MITPARRAVSSITDTWRVLHATHYAKKSLLKTQQGELDIHLFHTIAAISTRGLTVVMVRRCLRAVWLAGSVRLDMMSVLYGDNTGTRTRQGNGNCVRRHSRSVWYST